MEIERKYLVPVLPEGFEGYPCTEIEQGYLCTKPTVRVRRMGDRYILTVKENLTPVVPRDARAAVPAITNREEEFDLSPAAYQSLKSKCEGRLVQKTRYRIPLPATGANKGAELCAELDIFHGHHEGLRLVEVEFPDADSANAFVPPAWFGTEVTADPRYRNSHMALSSSPL